MKLDKGIQRRVDLLARKASNSLSTPRLAKTFPPALMEDYDAVVLCGGATKPREFNIEGSDLKGIHYAMDYLNGTIKSLLDSGLEDGNYLSAKTRTLLSSAAATQALTASQQRFVTARSVTQFGTHKQAPRA